MRMEALAPANGHVDMGKSDENGRGRQEVGYRDGRPDEVSGTLHST